MVIRLISIRWLSFLNGITRGAGRERTRARLSLLFSLLVVGGIGMMAYGFLSPFAELASSDPAMDAVLRRLPSFALFAAFWMLLLSGVTVGIQRFYLTQEFDLLFTAPLKPGTVFGAKFVEATLANAGLFLTVGAPMLAAYGYALGILDGTYVARLLVALAAFSALPTGIGLVLAFALMRVLPASRTRDLLGALGILAFALFYFVMSIGASRAHDPEALRGATNEFASLLALPLYQHGPWAWASAALSGANSASSRWAELAALVALAAVAVLATSYAARWLHWRGWSNAQEIAQSAVPTRLRVRPGGDWESRLRLLPGPIRAVFLKDFRSLGRDLRQLSLLFIPIAVVAVFMVNMSESETRRVPSILLILGLYPVLAMVALRLAMSGFVAENRALWLVMSAPNDARAVLTAKLLYACALSLPLGVVSTLGYAGLRGLGSAESVTSLALSVCVMAAFCGIGVGASAMFSDFGVENPRFTVSTAGRLVTFVAQMVYLGVLAAIVVVTWILGRAAPTLAMVLYTAAGVSVLALSAACIVAPIYVAAAKLRKLEW